MTGDLRDCGARLEWQRGATVNSWRCSLPASHGGWHETPQGSTWRSSKPASSEATRWAAGWYMRKRHAVAQGTDYTALCSPYTGVYALGNERSSRPGRVVPPANHPEVMALPACELCLRKLASSTPTPPVQPASNSAGSGEEKSKRRTLADDVAAGLYDEPHP